MMQYVTITTAQALFAALGMSVFACILAIALTVMAFVHLTGRWERRDESAELERDLYREMCGNLALDLSRLEQMVDEREGKR